MDRVSGFLEGEGLEIVRDTIEGDTMLSYPGAEEVYFEAGRSALRCIRLALLAAGSPAVGSILDYACGAGRVLRVLKAAYPDAALTACDLRRMDVRFCERTFGAKGVFAPLEPAELELDDEYDVIWCGSLFTHVDRDRWTALLRLFEKSLAAGGVAVFTAYGRATVENLRSGRNKLTFDDQQLAQVLRDYDETGFGFCASYRADANFGDAVASRAWVCAQLDEHAPRLRQLLYLERGWLSQDVIACAKDPVA
jgi:SAM-dependent methyltransferase